jgi:hypothetical protein
VSWFWDDYYYGWGPLSRGNRPVVVYDGHWWRDYRYRQGVPFHARSTTIIKKSQLSASGVQRVALKIGEAAKLSKKSLVFKGNAPNIRPTFSKVDFINARGKKVVYKKNSLISTGKYKVMKTTTGISKTKNESPVYTYPGKKLAKEKVAKYTKSHDTKGSSYDSQSYTDKTPEKSTGYKIKKYSSSSSSSGDKAKTKSKYYSDSSSSSSASSGKQSKIKKSSSKSGSTKSSSSGKSSGSNTIKKKKSEPSNSYQTSSKSYSKPLSSNKSSGRSSSSSSSRSGSSSISIKKRK